MWSWATGVELRGCRFQSIAYAIHKPPEVLEMGEIQVQPLDSAVNGKTLAVRMPPEGPMVTISYVASAGPMSRTSSRICVFLQLGSWPAVV